MLLFDRTTSLRASREAIGWFLSHFDILTDPAQKSKCDYPVCDGVCLLLCAISDNIAIYGLISHH